MLTEKITAAVVIAGALAGFLMTAANDKPVPAAPVEDAKVFAINIDADYLCKVFWNHGATTKLYTAYQCVDIMINNWQQATVLMIRPLEREEYALAKQQVMQKRLAK